VGAETLERGHQVGLFSRGVVRGSAFKQNPTAIGEGVASSRVQAGSRAVTRVWTLCDYTHTCVVCARG